MNEYKPKEQLTVLNAVQLAIMFMWCAGVVLLIVSFLALPFLLNR